MNKPYYIIDKNLLQQQVDTIKKQSIFINWVIVLNVLLVTLVVLHLFILTKVL